MSSEVKSVYLACIIVNLGQGSKVMHLAKQCGVKGGTISLGRGTVNNRILEYLGLSDIRKEVVLIISDNDTMDHAIDALDKEFKFEKPNHGIAFITSICSVIGTRSYRCDNNKEERGADNTMYRAITVIVDKGKAEDVIDAATRAGSKGGTIINARGSGIHETSKLFAMEIEPEKEIVLILAKTSKIDQIVSSIRESLKIDEPGNGIIFVQDIQKTYGLYE